jgi:signal transduction histidine kinase
MSVNNWLRKEDRGKAAEALHAIRNRLTAIFGFAELAQGGSRQAQERLLHEIADQTDAICSQLDVIDAAVRCTHRFKTRALNDRLRLRLDDLVADRVSHQIAD